MASVGGELAEIFKAYDIRGVVPDDLDEHVAEAVGAAFARPTGLAPDRHSLMPL